MKIQHDENERRQDCSFDHGPVITTLPLVQLIDYDRIDKQVTDGWIVDEMISLRQILTSVIVSLAVRGIAGLSSHPQRSRATKHALVNVSPPTVMNRRQAFLVGASVYLASATPANAVLSSKYCASGTGDGCADLAEGNEFIKSLQQKSAANKDKNEKVGLLLRKCSRTMISILTE